MTASAPTLIMRLREDRRTLDTFGLAQGPSMRIGRARDTRLAFFGCGANTTSKVSSTRLMLPLRDRDPLRIDQQVLDGRDPLCDVDAQQG